MAQCIEIPMIGQQDAVVASLRLQISMNVMAQLAVVDYGAMFRKAMDEDATMGGDGTKLQFHMNTGVVAQAAVAYADNLLIALGILRQPKAKKELIQ